MAEPLIYTPGDRERIGKAGATPVDIQHLRNLLGSLVLEDDEVPGGVTLLQLVNAAGEANTSGLTIQTSGQLSFLSSTEVRLSAQVTPARLIERQTVSAAIPHSVSWPQIDHTVVGVDDPAAYYVIQDPGFTGTGQILELSSPPSEADLRNPYILLGASYHWGGEVRRVVNFPAIWNDQGFKLDDLMATQSRIRRTSGRMSETAATLGLEHTAIGLWGRGLNFHASFLDPNRVTIGASGASVALQTIKPDGEEFAVAVTSVPKTWNSSGTETALTGSEAAVHQVAMGPDGQVFVQLGTTAYASYNAARDAIQSEVNGNPLWDGLTNFGTRLGYVVISATATVWADEQAHFFEETQGGGAASSPVQVRWTDLIDTPNNYSGQAGRVPKVNAAEGALEFGKVRASIQIAARDINVDASGGAELDVALPARIGAASMILDNVHFELVTATSGDDLEMDVFINGATIYGAGKPTITDGNTEVDAVPTVTTHSKGHKIRLDILSGNASWQYLTATLEGWIVPEV